MDEHIWDVDTSLYLVSRKIDDRKTKKQQAYANAARESLKSVAARLNHASYHFHEVNSAWQSFCERAATKKSPFAKLGFPIIGEQDNTHQWLSEAGALVRSAHLVACVQALHSIPDTLAYAISFCFELEIPERGERDINVGYVKGKLEFKSCAKFAVEALSDLKKEGNYKKINALSNYAKHRSIIDESISTDPDAGAEAPIFLRFKTFTFDDELYEAAEALPLLDSELKRMQSVVNGFGAALNAYFNELPNRS